MRIALPLILLVSPLALGGCAQDPYQRPDTWALPPVNGATGLSANDANLHVMVQNPRDLVAGTGDDNSAGGESAPPVQRLLSGRRKPLLDTDASSVDSGTGGAGQQQATPPAGGANVGQ